MTLMLRAITKVENYDQLRAKTKRKAVECLRHLVDSVPELGDVAVFLRADRRAQDACFTLHAMSFSPYLINVFVARRRFSEDVVLSILAAYVTASLVAVVKGVTNDR